MPAIFSKQSSVAFITLLVSFVKADDVLDTLPWTSCEGGTAYCGDLYFCATDATNWEYWNTPIDPMFPSLTWGQQWPTPQTIPAFPQAVGVDGQTPIQFCFLDPNGSNGFLYAYRSALSGVCRPGKSPVIRVQAGKKYRLTLHNTADLNDPINFPLVWAQLNSLGAEWIMDPTDPLKKKYYPTHSTNLHIHGLHQSGQGDFDNVLRQVFPGNRLTYTYIIPANQPGALHWYHPHFHGKVVEQVFGGAFGAFIIEDTKAFFKTPQTSVPKATPVDDTTANFFSSENKANERILYAYNGFNLWMGNGNPAGASLTLIKNQWHRVRVVHILPEGIVKWTQFMNFDATLFDPLTAAPLCEIRELAWDGTYASSVPYPSATATPPLKFAVHGAERVDYAIRCKGLGKFELKYGEIGVGSATRGRVATFTVVTGTYNGYTPFYKGASFKPYRPAWLADLRGSSVSALQSAGLTNVKYIGDAANYGSVFNLTVSMDGMNGVLFNPSVPTVTMRWGAENVHQVRFFGTGVHPTHMHQQHFQVIGGNCGPAMKIGEMYDTMAVLNPDDDLSLYDTLDPANYQSTKDGCLVRFRNIDYAGLQIFHCHVLDHEDIGIVGWFNVPLTPGCFELSSQFTNVARPIAECTPRLDAAGAVICRNTTAVCGTVQGYDTCNNLCSVTLPSCPTGYSCAAGMCYTSIARDAICSVSGSSAEQSSSSSSSSTVAWAIAGVSMAVAACAVLGAAWYSRAAKRSNRFEVVLTEEQKMVVEDQSPFLRCPPTTIVVH